MSEPRNGKNFLGGVINRVGSSKMRFAISILLLLLIYSNGHAQYNIAQSRFITGPGPFSQTCSVGGGTSASDCMPDINGVVHMRFDPDSVQVDDNGTAGDTDDDRLIFTIQVRKTGLELPYSVGGVAIDYNSEAFGESLNIPAFHNNSGDTALNTGQCDYTRGHIFTGTQNYKLTFADTSSSLLSVFAEAADFTSPDAPSTTPSTITNEWQDFVELACRIRFDANSNGSIDDSEGTMDADAGLAFSGRLWAENQVWIAATGDATTLNRTVFGVADNDLRGFRLDGKTWVEDYARHSDGKGVRLKFSKDVAAYNGSAAPAALTAANFSLESAGDAINITSVTHVPNEPYINIRLESAISNGILRLVSNATSTVRDSESNDLANDNFVAALAYDADAPYATGISRVAYRSTDGIGRSEWEVSFSKPLNPATVLKENLCLTGADGLCAPAVGSATTPSIVSVEINGANTTLTLVINEGRVKQLETLSLEFRRNAVLDEDFKVVEDYQTALRDEIELTDEAPPVITVEAQGTAVPTPGVYIYTVRFTVSSDEAIADLGNRGSYYLAGVKQDGSLIQQTGLVETREKSGELKESVDISYTIAFPTHFSFEDLQDLKGFTLLRGADGSLSDSAGNGPEREDGSKIPEGARIDLSDEAIADRDTTPPHLTLSKDGNAVPDAGNPRLYTGQFTIKANEDVADLGSTASYRLLRKPIGSGDLIRIDSAIITRVSVSNDQLTAMLGYEVELEDIGTVLQTEGFTLARGNNPQYLLDDDYNFPVRVTAPSEVIGINEPINSGVISTRETDEPTIMVQAINLGVDVDPRPSVETIYAYEALPDEGNGNRYTTRFAVKADRPISNIADINSYTLIANPIDSNRPIGASSMTVSFSAPQVSSDGSATTLTYSVELDSVDATQRIAGFTLGPGSNTLIDIYSNELTIGVGNALVTAAAAIARRDTTSPQLSVMVDDANQSLISSDGYQISFTTTATEFDIRGRTNNGSYKLLRKLGDDSHAVIEAEPSSISVSSPLSLIVNYRNVQLTEAEARDTVAFALGRSGNALRDRANNDPITVGLDGNVIVKPNAPFDVRSDGESKVNTTHPSITVERQGPIMSIENKPLMYRGSFMLSANTTVDEGIRGGNGILGLSESDSYWLWRIPVDGSEVMPSTQTAQIMIEPEDPGNEHNSATVSFTTVFDTPEAVIQTKGFTLARRDNLLDYASNYPVDPVNTDDEIERGDRLDSRDEAVALRDSVPPEYMVTTNGQLSIESSGYTMAFNVNAPEDVSDSNLRSAQSYRLLRKLNDNNYEPIAGIPENITQSSTNTFIVSYVNVLPLLSISDAQLTAGFTLGRSFRSLRDLANNDPVVQIGGSTITVTVVPALPLDAKPEALFTIEEESPSLKVLPRGEVTKIDTRYIGSFDLNSNEGIDGIESTASYVLLRVPQRSNDADPPSTPVVVLTKANLSVDNIAITLRSATVRFDVNDSEATSKHRFTLARKTRLSDLVGNPLVDPGDNDRVVTTNTRIDSRVAAEAPIPALNTPKPIISVVAEGRGRGAKGGGIANADENNPLVYTGSFEVSADREVSGIGYGGSYKLLQIDSEGSHVEATATIGVSSGEMTADVWAQIATITFSTTLTTVETLRKTFGFTLGYVGNLNDGPLLPSVDTVREDRLDTSAAAVAEIPLQITAEAIADEANSIFTKVADTVRAYPSFDPGDLGVNGNEYSMLFRVRSVNYQPVPEIDSINSYVLLHIPTSNDLKIDNLSPYISTNTVQVISSDTNVIVKYTVRFGDDNDADALANTQRTAGFALGRAPGKLQLSDTVAPLNSVGDPIAGGARINPSDDAIAKRDTTSPEISVINNSTLSADGFRFDFTAETEPSEYLQAQWNSAEDFVILRKRDTDPVEYERIEELGLSSLSLSTLSNRQEINSTVPFRLSEEEAKETLGFTVGYNNSLPLRDLANNPVYIGGSDPAQSVARGEPFDIRNAALMMRETTSPFIEVTAQEITAIGTPNMPKYRLIFDIATKQLNADNQKVDALDVIGSTSTKSYQLLRKLENNNYETVGVEKLDLLSANAISTTQARITFGSVNLTVAEIQETLSFTLGRAPNNLTDDPNDCKLCDYASNAPLVAGTTRTAEVGEPLDPARRAEAIIEDKTGPRITVKAIGTATPNATNPPNSYSGSFEVRSNEPIGDLHDEDSYTLLRVLLTKDGDAGKAMMTTAALTLPPATDSNATSLTITFNVDLGRLALTQKTYGFTLGRADDPNDCSLCDETSNPPIVGDGARLDSADTAIVRRDIEPPRITVTPVGNFMIQPFRNYTMTFRVTTPTDVTDLVDSELRTVSSYQLLRKLTVAAGGGYQVVSGVQPQDIALNGDINLVYNESFSSFSIAEISETESFTLGLGIEGRLRDTSGNDLVVSGSGEKVTVDPPRPLDANPEAHLMVERNNPHITVSPNVISDSVESTIYITKNETNYAGSFKLRGHHRINPESIATPASIDGLESTASYVLLRVPQRANASDPSGTPVVLNDAHITISGPDLRYFREATIDFSVNDPEATSKHSFTLGRKTRLSDLVGNPLIDPDSSDGDLIVAPRERIDSRIDAETPIPALDTPNPRIRVKAQGKATPTPDNRLQYTGSFRVSSNEIVTLLLEKESYKLLHINDQGTHTTVNATITVNQREPSFEGGEIEAEVASVSFKVTLDQTQLIKTVGFTLGRRANLSLGNVLPIINRSQEDRLDASPDAVALIDRLLQITAEAIVDTTNNLVMENQVADAIKAYPEVDLDSGDVNGNQYSMLFRVRSGSSEAIPGIESTSSYVLLHIPTSDDKKIDDLSPYISTSTVQAISDTDARVRYTVKFGDDNDADALARTQGTAGFTLGRAAGKLQKSGILPLDDEGELIRDGGRIGSSDTAIAKRDITPPEIRVRVTRNDTNVDGYLLSFGASTYPRELLKTEWNDLDNYVILRQLNTDAYSPIAEVSTGIRVTFTNRLNDNLSIRAEPSRLSENQALETKGFTLGYSENGLPIRDLANNDAFHAGTTQTLMINQAFDSTATALAIRDTNPPFVEVTARPIIALEGYYRLIFDMEYKKIVKNESVATNIHSNLSAYQLLREVLGNEFKVVEKFHTSSLQSGDNDGTLIYTRVNLSPKEVEQTKNFTLGRAPSNPNDPADCKLCDYSSNAPVVVGTTITAMAGEPLDTNDRAKAKISREAAMLTVEAIGMAEPTLENGDIYTMQFKVKADREVSGLELLESYKLTHKPTAGSSVLELEDLTSGGIQTISLNTEVELNYRVGFEDTESQTQRTEGFTLSRTSDLVDIYDNAPANRQGQTINVGDEIDTTSTAIARRDTKPPAIAITARNGRAFQDNDDSYRMSFLVTTVPKGDQVRGLDSKESYNLLQIFQDDSVITATALILNTTSTAAGFRLDYSGVEIPDPETAANPTTAFTLGRSGTSLRDLANNDPVDANPDNATEKIDEKEEKLDSRRSALARLIKAILIRAKVFLEGPLQ